MGKWHAPICPAKDATGVSSNDGIQRYAAVLWWLGNPMDLLKTILHTLPLITLTGILKYGKAALGIPCAVPTAEIMAPEEYQD